MQVKLLMKSYMGDTMSNFKMIFLDTSFIIAFFNKKDKNFTKAREIIRNTMEKSKNTLYVYSDYIFDELITLLKTKHIDHIKIQQIGDQLLNSTIWKIIIVNEDIFHQTWKMMTKYQDKEWSFTDTSSFALMEKFNINHYLSYDRHFAQYPKIQRWSP